MLSGHFERLTNQSPRLCRGILAASDLVRVKIARSVSICRHDYSPHVRRIARRRCAKLTCILATELRRTFVTDRMGNLRRISGICEQPLTRFLSPDLLVILKRRHGCHRLEMAVEGRRAHIRRLSQRLDS